MQLFALKSLNIDKVGLFLNPIKGSLMHVLDGKVGPPGTRDRRNEYFIAFRPNQTSINAIMCFKRFKSVDETLVCDHLNESYRAVLSCGVVYYAVQGGQSKVKSGDEILVFDHSNESY